MRHGEGCYTYAVADPETPADCYNGHWDKNLKSGIGKQIYQGVGTYYGYWCNNERHGEGVMSYSNEDVYSGNWCAGQKEGQGTYIFYATKQKYVGKFFKGQMQQGQWQYCDGSYFEGCFDNNMPKGAGHWNFKCGNVVAGCYK